MSDPTATRVSVERLMRQIEGEVARELRGLASFESPKKVALLEEDFTIANGVLTPTLKVKRKVIQDRFRDLVEELYREDSTGTRHR